MDATRYLVVIADDYGMGPETSRGILELAAAGVVTGAVFIVNTSYTTAAANACRKSRLSFDMGWHPNLTMHPPRPPPPPVPAAPAPRLAWAAPAPLGLGASPTRHGGPAPSSLPPG